MGYREPTIDEAMADPMIRKVMTADHQSVQDVALLLRGAAHRVRASRASAGLAGRWPLAGRRSEGCSYC